MPGFVDAHSHGGGGAAFTSGDPAEAATVLATHRAHGTTTMMASLVTDTTERLEASVRALAPLVRAGELAGIHLEGPWLSADHCGAHDPALLRAPDPAEVTRLLDAGGGAVRMVTLAPELAGGLEAVRLLADRGVIAALGHSDATYDVARQAVDAGISDATHLFNAMRPIHHREPGPVLALVDDPRVFIELVADGVHLHPEVLRWAATSAAHRFLLVTDAMSAAGAGDGDYVLGPAVVQVRDGVARLASNGAIAGSTLTMDRAVRHAVQVAGAAARRRHRGRDRHPGAAARARRRRRPRGRPPGRPRAPRRRPAGRAGHALRRLALTAERTCTAPRAWVGSAISAGRARGARGAGSARR